MKVVMRVSWMVDSTAVKLDWSGWRRVAYLVILLDSSQVEMMVNYLVAWKVVM
jgi:hypothetical protein